MRCTLRNNQIKRIALLFVCAMFGALSLNAKLVKKNDIAPDFRAKTGEGREFHLADAVKERYVLLNFTAIGCGYCWMIYPYLEKLQEKYNDKLQIVNIHTHDSETPAMWGKMKIKMFGDVEIQKNLTVVWQAGFLKESYPTKGVPTFVLINKEGVVVKSWFSGNPERLIKIVKKEMAK